MQKNEPLERVKCYADAPDGTQNKYLVFKVYDFSHTFDVLNRLVSKGWTIRAAWHQFDNGGSVKIPREHIDGDLSTTYKAKKELDLKLDEYFSNLMRTI